MPVPTSAATRPFRFGVVAAPRGTGEQWLATTQRVADRGYTSLLVPDGLGLHAPFPALATAAAVPDLRLGTFVLAAPLRPPRSAAWEAHSMTVLTGGRFDLGIGTGRPDARAEAGRLGMPWGSGTDRLELVRETVAHLRDLDGGDLPGGLRTPVLMAASGPRALVLAAAQADIVTLAAPPLTERDEVQRMAHQLWDLAGDRAPRLELAMNVFIVGDEVPPWAAHVIGGDPAQLRGKDTLAVLRGSTPEMADELRRRRDTLGVSYLAVSEAFVDDFAPVAALLTGT